MADDRITGTRRALKRGEARTRAYELVDHTQYCLKLVEQDRWEDASIAVDYILANLENLRDNVTELKR